MAARTSLALQGLFHPAADRVLDWDVRRAPEVLARPGVMAGLGESGRLLEPRLGGLAAAVEATKALPSGLQHADVTLTNVLATEGTVTGLIDFGDMHHTAAVCDLAVTLTLGAPQHRRRPAARRVGADRRHAPGLPATPSAHGGRDRRAG